MTVVTDLRTLWRFPNFRRLLTVRLLSQFSDGAFQVGLATYVVFSPEQQTTPGDIAAAMAVLLLPYSLLGPFAGVLLDRWRRRQVLFYGNLLRAVMAAVTCALVIHGVPNWLFYLSALSVTGVNRFILAGLSASLPRVVDPDRLVVANSLSPTAGTLAATVGGGVTLVTQVLTHTTVSEDALALIVASLIYGAAGIAALRMGRDLLGPNPGEIQPRVMAALASTARGLAAGLRHLTERRLASWALAGVVLMRFGYGALLVMLLMLARNSWGNDGNGSGMTLLGLAVGSTGAGFFAAAVLTPGAVVRWGRLGWFSLCAATTAVLLPPLGLPFHPVPMLIAAFMLGLTSQGAKIVTDTVVQSSIDDVYRGRIFALYDMLFNIAFVGSAGLAALMLPTDGRSVPLLLLVSALFALTAALIFRLHRGTVSRETPPLPPVSPGKPTIP
ncbi:putative MFS-type transporter [Streptomyces sp. enrichment culture]|uniref:MFS transporter n=1 Tax=Streptomyces sp. enrichment culture TaxID=1795815 RepID=UPI003F57C28A